MQIIVTFENEGTCIRQSILCTVLWIMLSCFVVNFTEMLAYSGIQLQFI